jgi:hypothetical protein
MQTGEIMTKLKSKLAAKLGDEIHELMDEIKKERGELELKMYLAKAEVRDEWEKAEKKWHEFKAQADLLAKEAREASGDVSKAAKSLAQELKSAYKRIYHQLKQL